MKRLLAMGVIIALLTLTGCGKEEPAPKPTMSPQEQYLLALQFAQYQRQQEEENALRAAQRNLVISEVKVNNWSSSTECTGKVTNNSTNITYEFVKVKGAFTDYAGNVIDTDWTYAAGEEGLAPGESTKFTIYVDLDYKIKNCIVTLMDADT